MLPIQCDRDTDYKNTEEIELMDANKQTVHMNPGEGETSYAGNSAFQSAEQMRMKPLIEGAVKLYCTTSPLPDSILIADLGCSSGPNAIALVSTAVDAVHHQYLQLQQPPPELSLLFNDLHSNDFNTVLKHLAEFQHRLSSDDKAEVSFPLVRTSIVPGSFYGRLFGAGSVHLFLSSSSLHWLSQVPEDLLKNGIPMYHAEENLWLKMRPVVLDAYARQFRKDFMQFLGCRAQEIVPGGMMVLSLSATHSHDYEDGSIQPWEYVARILDEMASRSLLDKQKLRTFYIPLYAPHEKEVKEIIEEQGSFSICKLQAHDHMSGMNKARVNPKMIAYTLRAIYEPIIKKHFGSSGEILDEFVRTVEQHMTTLAYPQDIQANKKPSVFLAMTLAKKG